MPKTLIPTYWLRSREIPLIIAAYDLRGSVMAKKPQGSLRVCSLADSH